MNMQTIHLEKREVYEYPKQNKYFNPSTNYPEYIFGESALSEETNHVYDMVRMALIGLNLDSKHFNLKEWNPLGDGFIRPGDTVLIKPNIVNNYATIKEYECTLTHPSVIRAVIDYCIIAQAGKIIIGDAPIEEAKIEQIFTDFYYNHVIDFYKSRQIKIELLDFRLNKKGSPLAYDAKLCKEIDLGNESKHCTNNANQEYRISTPLEKFVNYFHNESRHAYLVTNEVFSCDVIINLPKPKTHKLAGITGAQKNFIGIISNKRCLPHFKSNSPKDGGDEINMTTVLSKILCWSYKKYLSYNDRDKTFKAAKLYLLIYIICNKLKSHKLYSGGQWYGNDTIWRTTLDVIKIVLYANKDGKLNFNTNPKKVLNIGDMIIAGEGEGPIHPTPKKSGIIIASFHLIAFDYLICKISGYNPSIIPTVKFATEDTLLNQTAAETVLVSSNIKEYKNMVLKDICFPATMNLKRNKSWINAEKG